MSVVKCVARNKVVNPRQGCLKRMSIKSTIKIIPQSPLNTSYIVAQAEFHWPFIRVDSRIVLQKLLYYL